MEAARRGSERGVNGGGAAYTGRRRSPYISRSRDRSPYIAAAGKASPPGRKRSPYIARDRSPYIAKARSPVGLGLDGGRTPQGSGYTRGRSPGRVERSGARSPHGLARTRGRSPLGIGRTGGRSPLGIGRTGGHSPLGIGRTGGRTSSGIGGTVDRSPYISRSLNRSPLGMRYARSPSPYLSRCHSPQGMRYDRSLSPYLLVSRHRSPLGMGYIRSPELYRDRSPLWMGRSRSPRGIDYRRSLSPYSQLCIGPSLLRHDGLSRGSSSRLYRSPPRRVRRIRSRSPRLHASDHRSPQRGRTSRLATDRARPHPPPTQSYVLQVKNFPTHCSDDSVRRGLQHMFKKYGRIYYVPIEGAGEERYALIIYKDAKDRETALAATKGAPFFGMAMDVTIYEGPKQSAKSDSRNTDNVVFTHRASMTLYVGNLAKATTATDLTNTFKSFGEILHSEVKVAPGPCNYGFLQFDNIPSVSNAINKMNGKLLGTNKLRLGFGKNQPSNCIWVYGLLSTNITEKTITRHFRRFGTVGKVLHDTVKGTALVLFKDWASASSAVHRIKNGHIDGHVVKVLFANRRCQLAFCRSMESSGQNVGDFHKKLLEKSEEEPQMLAEEIDESYMVAEASDEEAQMVAEASDEEEAQIVAEASDKETQMEAEASAEQPQILEESKEEPQISVELCDKEPHAVAGTGGEASQKE